MLQLTLASIGKYFADIEAEHVLDSLDDCVKGIISGLKSYPLNFPGTALHHAIKVTNHKKFKMNAYLVLMLQQCRRKAMAIFRQELERRKKSGAAVPKNDLMEELMQMKDEEGNRLSDVEVLDNIVTLIVAGYASTAVAIMWALYYLSKYPDVLQKLRVWITLTR